MRVPRSGAKTHSLFAAFPCCIHDMNYMYRVLITLIRKLCTIVCLGLDWNSPSIIARLLNRVMSFILKASRAATSKSPPNDAGDPFPTILLPSDAVSMEPCAPVRSPSKIEEGLSAAAVNRISTEETPQTDLSPRAREINDDKRRLPPPELTPSPATSFVPMLPSDSDRYIQKIIMCVH